MKLRNKKTGEIIKDAYVRESHDFCNKRTIAIFVRDGHRPPERVSAGYSSLAELNAEWEDAPEEPKEHWAIDIFGEPIDTTNLSRLQLEKLRQFGNDFKTKEGTELAVRKLKAWERLKDKGFRFKCCDDYHIDYEITGKCAWTDETEQDLDLLFSGEGD